MLKFTYTKPNGEVSQRTCLVLSSPSDNYLMLDLSELDELELFTMQRKFDLYNEELKALRHKYDLDLYIKNFKESRMTNLEKI